MEPFFFGWPKKITIFFWMTQKNRDLVFLEMSREAGDVAARVPPPRWAEVHRAAHEPVFTEPR